MANLLTRRVLDASETTAEGLPWREYEPEDAAAADADERQSATARRRGSGGFLSDEDLSLDAPPKPSCSLALPGLLLDGLYLVDDILSIRYNLYACVYVYIHTYIYQFLSLEIHDEGGGGGVRVLVVCLLSLSLFITFQIVVENRGERERDCIVEARGGGYMVEM